MDMIFPQVLQAVPAKGYAVYAYMNDGTIRLFNAAALIERGGVFAPLGDMEVFRAALTVLNDTIAWDLSGKRDPADCIDIDPFTVRDSPAVAEWEMTA